MNQLIDWLENASIEQLILFVIFCALLLKICKEIILSDEKN